MKNTILLILVLFIFCESSTSQNFNYKMSAYIDSYYAIDNDRNIDALSHKTRPYSYINKQKDEFRLNIAQLQGDFNYNNSVRGVVVFHVGDLLHTGWEDLGANDPTLQQANAGFQAFKNFWIDAGYFLTHIGGEMLLPKDNWLSSHSLVTNFEPFYQSGVRFSYEVENFTAQIHLLNGNGIFEDNNYNKSVGCYLSYKISDDLLISYSNVFGNEEAGSPQNSRLLAFHNFDVFYDLSQKLRIKGQLDIANLVKRNEFQAQSYWGIAAEGQYKFIDKMAFSARGSYISTDNYLFTNAETGYEIAAGFEYKPYQPVYVRIEGRVICFDENYTPFRVGNEDSSRRFELMLNFGVLLQ